MIDIVIVGDMNQVTINCLNSLRNSYYDNPVFVVPFEGYNKSLNNGARKGKSQWIAFCNNDLEFTESWDSNLLESYGQLRETKVNDSIVSLSPWCPITHYQWWGKEVPKEPVKGTQTGKIVAGWCLILQRAWWEEMGGFDERLEFWCCDNSYTMQLEQAKKLHCLVPSSKVLHHQSTMLNELKGTPKYDELTKGQVKKFNRLYNQNLFGWGQ